ncbi:hypothetical protein OG21DRAFT_1527744, partial [Imleria badia]
MTKFWKHLNSKLVTAICLQHNIQGHGFIQSFAVKINYIKTDGGQCRKRGAVCGKQFLIHLFACYCVSHAIAWQFASAHNQSILDIVTSSVTSSFESLSSGYTFHQEFQCTLSMAPPGYIDLR